MQDSPDQHALRSAHPLALQLIALLAGNPGARVLEIGRGSGRNARALEAAGLAVSGLDDPSRFFAGALSTHALLHGTTADIAGLLAQIADRLPGGAPLLCTFGSVRDARFGTGRRLGPNTFAPLDGDERDVPHTFFDEGRLRAIVAADWDVQSLLERNVDNIAGTWAHAEKPLRGSLHYLASLRRR